MDPNDPTRIQPAAEPQAGWPPPPPGPYGRPGGYEAPPTASYPAAAPPPHVPQSAGPQGGEPKPSRPSRGLLITGGILALLLAGVIGFIVGVQVEKGRQQSSTVATGSTTSTTLTTPTSSSAGKKAGKGGGGKANKATGTVGTVTGNGFTVTMADGTTVSVVVSARTVYTKSGVPGSLQDVTPGARVVVTGARGQNGAITARVVAIG